MSFGGDTIEDIPAPNPHAMNTGATTALIGVEGNVIHADNLGLTRHSVKLTSEGGWLREARQESE
jgi:hypothetical protein